MTPGGRHTYWFYPLSVDAWEAVEFAKALTAEGVGAGAGYIGQPIYLCMEALWQARRPSARQATPSMAATVDA